MAGTTADRDGLLLCMHELVALQSASRTMSAHGWTAVATASVDQALVALGHAGCFQAVLVDLELPDIDARAFLSEAEDLQPGIDVILLVASTKIEAAVATMEQGAADFLTKPMRAEELELRLHRLRQVREQREELARLQTILGDRVDDPQHRPPDPGRPFTLHLDGLLGVPMLDLVRRFEAEIIEWALAKAQGSACLAAAILGVPPDHFERRS